VAETGAATLLGTTLGGAYRLTREIGRGGMGAVYEGVHLRLNRRVAVKLMARELATNTEALARFRREAEVTSQLGHPHIVQVFDFGEAPTGEPYLVMEFLEGEDLEGRLRRAGRLPAAATAHIIKQIASALAATHGKGIVHRDLKPANVFVLAVEGETDFVKVVDFGISKVKAATTRLTAAAAVMGTPNYMSPEQAAGRIDEIDGATDQWALACIAYELLAGRPPFVGDNIASLLYQVVHEAPSPLGAHALGLPPGIDAVLTRALAKKPTERFESVAAFSRAFESAASGVPVAPAPTALAVSGPSAAPAGLAIAATGLAGTYVPSAAPPKAAETTFSAAAGEALATRATAAGGGRWRGIGFGAVGVAAIAIGAVVITRSGGGAPPAPTSASAPPTTTSASATTAPAVAPPPVVTPPAAAIPPTQPPKPSEAPPGEHASRSRHKKGRGAVAEAPAAAPKAREADAPAPGPTWPPQPKAKTEAAPEPAPTWPPQPAPEADAPTWPPPGTTPDTSAPPPPKKRKRLMQRIFGD